MGHRGDDQLFEGLLLDELELLSEVITAAAVSAEPLTRAQVDEALGILTEPAVRLRGSGQTRRDAIEPAANPPLGLKAQRFWNRETAREWRTSMDMGDG